MPTQPTVVNSSIGLVEAGPVADIAQVAQQVDAKVLAE
jgi:hypothetical protein